MRDIIAYIQLNKNTVAFDKSLAEKLLCRQAIKYRANMVELIMDVYIK